MNVKQNTAILQLINQKQFLYQDKEGLLLKELSSKESQEIINCSGEFRNRLYTPLKTLHIFVKQALSADKSCNNAVAGFVIDCLKEDKKPVSSNTSAYIKARERLSTETIYQMIQSVSRAASATTPIHWKPYGRDLKVADGTTITLPDTKANNEAYPKHSNKKEGVGFPMIRLLVLMSLITGCVIDYAFDACKGKGTGEISLLWRIIDGINAQDIFLADRLFCHFFLFHDLQKKQADTIVPGHTQRRYDFRHGQRLGTKDHIIWWQKPRRPDWMSKTDYDQYPDAIQVREFKRHGMVYVTTFLNAKTHPKQELHTLYKRRWGVELHLNSIKTVMNMNRLSCKTPNMVEKEIGVHLLAYNMIRKFMVEACVKHQLLPWQISFKATLQLLNQFIPHFLSTSGKKRKLLYANLLLLIVKNKVGNRPGRVEPRAVRPKTRSFPILKNTRKDEKQKLLQQRKITMGNNEAA
jgi:hypothetical protein